VYWDLRKITHMFFALALALWFLRSWSHIATSIKLYYAFIAVAVFSSTIPDLDLKLKHRKTLHNITVPVLTGLVLWTLVPQALLLVVAFILGWLSHVLLDALTTRGVYPLHPLLDYKLALKLCKSENSLWNTTIILLSLLVVTLLLAK
jgi:inner membrane protein